jgi:hypothetical protein
LSTWGANGNDGKANVADDPAALDHGGVAWPADVIAELASDLNHEFDKLETAAAGHRADYWLSAPQLCLGGCQFAWKLRTPAPRN